MTFGHETWIKVPESSDRKEIFAVCLKTDDESLLFPKKVYKVNLSGNRVRVIDEEGEVAIYPKDFFLVLSLSPSAESTLAGVLG